MGNVGVSSAARCWCSSCLVNSCRRCFSQGHDGQREAERSSVSVTAQQDVARPRAHGRMDHTGRPSAERSAPGETPPPRGELNTYIYRENELIDVMP